MNKILSLILVILLAGFAAAQAAQTQPAEKTPEQLAQERQQAEMALIQQIQANANNPQAQALAADEFVQKFADSPNIAFVRFQATLANQRLNNFDKMVEHGNAFMALVPNHPVIPIILANGYAENNKPEEAEALATKARTMLNAMTKPEGVPQEQWDAQIGELKGTLSSTLGYVHLQKAGKLDKKDNARETELNLAVDEFKNAVAANKMDDISWYRVGITYALLNKVDECLDAYAKAIAINQSVAERAKTDMGKVLDTLKESNQLGDRTLDGLVAKAKQDLGIA
ncbi:MAG TPA: hypothetical protein PK176_14690 [Acidobacteriota bacterium]|nr:hypothetical protein [Acidobacteriota bacterium]HQM64555.1 hypothetical protein [Acidobacteriota bacterium]